MSIGIIGLTFWIDVSRVKLNKEPDGHREDTQTQDRLNVLNLRPFAVRVWWRGGCMTHRFFHLCNLDALLEGYRAKTNMVPVLHSYYTNCWLYGFKNVLILLFLHHKQQVDTENYKNHVF